jgi:hypothetical protein
MRQDATDRSSTPKAEKPCKIAKFPDAPVRSRMHYLGFLIRWSQVRILPGALLIQMQESAKI